MSEQQVRGLEIIYLISVTQTSKHKSVLIEDLPAAWEIVDIMQLCRTFLEPNACVVLPMLHSLQDGPRFTHCIMAVR